MSLIFDNFDICSKLLLWTVITYIFDTMFNASAALNLFFLRFRLLQFQSVSNGQTIWTQWTPENNSLENMKEFEALNASLTWPMQCYWQQLQIHGFTDTFFNVGEAFDVYNETFAMPGSGSFFISSWNIKEKQAFQYLDSRCFIIQLWISGGHN